MGILPRNPPGDLSDSLSLKPADCLLYSPKGIYGWIISLKTWHPIAHVEVYIGKGKSAAARDGVGVGEYPVRLEQLSAVLRPCVPFDLDRAMRAFERKWRGQGYDWLGLLRFAWRATVVPERFDNRQFCSELATRFYRAGGLDPFNGEDADAIAPFQFGLSPLFRKVQAPDVEVAGKGGRVAGESS